LQSAARGVCGSWTYKPNSVCRIAPAGRSFLWATHYCGAQATYPEVVTRRAGTIPPVRSIQIPAPGPIEPARIPPYLVLLRVGFALPAALLRRRCALTAPFHPYPAAAGRSSFVVRRQQKPQSETARLSVSKARLTSNDKRPTTRNSGAVCFLWHFPSTGLEPGLPDVIRHTALWSSDFPPRPFSQEP